MTTVVPLAPVPHPLAVLATFRHTPRPALLHSANPQHPTGRYSYFGSAPVCVVTAPAEEWPQVSAQVRRTLDPDRPIDPSLPPFQGGWIGWMGYELGRAFGDMRCAPSREPATADVALGLYDWIIAWDHHHDRAWLISTGIGADGVRDTGRANDRAAMVLRQLEHAHARPEPAHVPDGRPVDRDFTPDEFRETVRRTIDHVLRGDIFQANIAQRFVTDFTADPIDLFATVAARTHAPMAAYLHHDAIVVSGSPERFLRYDAHTRRAESRPIKGTRPRSADASEDARLAEELVRSEKERAENVMIVDLVRNDLARVCDAASVAVTALCALESHPTVHHLVSTVEGALRAECDALDLIAAAFPGGSVTGAPKLRAMEVIASLEPVRRGVYCGAIGWIGLDGSLDTSIAIRTIMISNQRAMVYAGGGITALSDPGAEHDETLDKVRALLESLGARP